MPKPALIVDDNADYVDMLLAHFEPIDFQFDHAWDAAVGYQTLEEVGAGYYKLIITDITMERQTAGLKLIRKIRKYGYKGIILVASTGFNNQIVLRTTRILMKWWGVDVLVPKAPLKEGHLECIGLSQQGISFCHEITAYFKKK